MSTIMPRFIIAFSANAPSGVSPPVVRLFTWPVKTGPEGIGQRQSGAVGGDPNPAGMSGLSREGKFNDRKPIPSFTPAQPTVQNAPLSRRFAMLNMRL